MHKSSAFWSNFYLSRCLLFYLSVYLSLCRSFLSISLSQRDIILTLCNSTPKSAAIVSDEVLKICSITLERAVKYMNSIVAIAKMRYVCVNIKVMALRRWLLHACHMWLVSLISNSSMTDITDAPHSGNDDSWIHLWHVSFTSNVFMSGINETFNDTLFRIDPNP